MKGFHVPRQAGWDCHGLPVELEVEKALGLKHKQDIEAFGIAEFNARCRESVLTYVDAWERMSERMGYWADFEHAYRTMDSEYVESTWWALQQIHERGLLTEDHRVAPYCPRCETALSSHELGQPGVYTDVESPSVVRALSHPERRLGRPGGPTDLDHHAVDPRQQHRRGGAPGHHLRAGAPSRAGTRGGRRRGPRGGRARRGLGDRRAPAGAGPGAGPVRQAVRPGRHPGRARRRARRLRDDRRGHRVGAPRARLRRRRPGGLPALRPADGQPDRPGRASSSTRSRWSAACCSPTRTPSCWTTCAPAGCCSGGWPTPTRTRTAGAATHALLYYATQSWYIRTTRCRTPAGENERTGWYPEHIKHGRYGDWLTNNVDWALSRSRYWGTPLPIWRCDEGHLPCVGSLAELGDVRRARPDRPGPAPALRGRGRVRLPDLRGHRRRVPEVVDVWFDSGSMPFAQWGYRRTGARRSSAAATRRSSSARPSTRPAAGSTR